MEEVGDVDRVDGGEGVSYDGDFAFEGALAAGDEFDGGAAHGRGVSACVVFNPVYRKAIGEMYDLSA